MDGRARSPLLSALCAIAACLLSIASSTAAASQSQGVRVGRAPLLPHGAQATVPVVEGKQLQITVALKSQDPSGLAKLAEAVSTPGSPLFRHDIDVTEFAQRFGASNAQVAVVRAAFQAQGLTVGAPTANDLTLPVSGTAAQVEKAFAISLTQVELSSGRTAYANAQAPLVPARAAQYVAGVIGLNNLVLNQPEHARPAHQPLGPPRISATTVTPATTPRTRDASASSPAQVVTGGPQPCKAAHETTENLGGGSTADQIAAAYQLSSLYSAGDFGAGQTIALFEQQAFNESDIAAYQACYGTSATVTPIDVDGGPATFSAEDIEPALDIEQVIGLAPQAHVLVYQGPIEQEVAPIRIISRIVSDDVAKVISTSWGLCEAHTFPEVMSAENTLLQEAAVQGQSFFAASGDSGSEQCEQSEEPGEEDLELAVLNPASQPFATGVGGTSLYSVDSEGKIPYDGTLPPIEGVWNNGARSEESGGTGGGISERWTMPSYQSSAAGSVGVVKDGESSGVPCGSAGGLCRQVPDIAADADPETGYVVFVDGGLPHGGWTVIGGTSASAPLWAALTALANSSPACGGASIGFANPTLYAIAGSNYASNFRDVVEPSPITGRANNNTAFGVGPFPVLPGYDMTTGIGAPLGASLAASLCSLASPPPLPTPQPQVIPQPTAPSTAPAPSTGAAQTAGVSAAQIKSALVAQLTPSSKTARIAALLKASGLSLALKALEPGVIVIDWYELPPGAKLAKKTKPKPLLVASGQLKFSAAGTKTLKLKLTAAGKALLKRSKHVKLTAKGTFTPSGEAAVSATKPFTLKR
jgi:subtilase family serine protease